MDEIPNCYFLTGRDPTTESEITGLQISEFRRRVGYAQNNWI